MKARCVPALTARERRLIDEQYNRDVRRGVEKCQWIMMLALNRACGIGETRFVRAMELYPELLAEYKGYERDDVADEMLARAMKQILPNSFKVLYSED